MHGLARWAGCLSLLVTAAGAGAATTDDGPPALATAVVAASSIPRTVGFDGVVEAVRRTVLSSQVAAAVTTVHVQAGDRVTAGQVLIRLDARAAEQQAGASEAQARAAHAARLAAVKELARQRQLFDTKFISREALDRAEAQFEVANAQAHAQLAAAQATRTAAGFYVVKAPYAGVVSEVPVVIGDMAMPGKPLATLYDPHALRVTAAVPQAAVPRAGAADLPSPQLQVPEVSGTLIAPLRWQVLPAADATTHTVELRLDLPPSTPALPGMFARVWLAAAADGPPRVWVPLQAVVHRAELTGVYVVDGRGRALLRQVRLGTATGDRVEVLTGLAAGEHVALDPQAAARRP